MRGFGGRLQSLWRASLQQRVLAGTPSGLHYGTTAASSAAADGERFQQSFLEEVTLLRRAVNGFRGFRCCSLLHDSINVEVASMGESITGMQFFTLDNALLVDVPKEWATSWAILQRTVGLPRRGVHCCYPEAARQWRGGR